MAKSVESSVEVLRGVSKALLAANEAYVKEKKEKDEIINTAFRIIKREFKNIEDNA